MTYFGADADLAVRLANSAGSEDTADALTSVAGLRSFLADPGWRSAATPLDLASLRKARPRVRQVFERAVAGDTAGTVDLLNNLLRHASLRPRLIAGEQSPELVLIDSLPSVAAGYLSSAVLGLASEVARIGVERLGLCAATGCGQVFLDTSAKGARRYCSERCASRTHVAAHRARRTG